MKSDASVIEDIERLRPQDSEVFRLRGNNGKIKLMTGYEPDYDIEKGLTLTIDWFKSAKNLKFYKTDIYNV